MNSASPGILVTQLAAKVGCTLGLESTSHYDCQLHTACRQPRESVGLWGFQIVEIFNYSIPPESFYDYCHTPLYRQQVFGFFSRGLMNQELVAEMHKNDIQEVFAGVAFCQQLIQSEKISDYSSTCGKTNNTHAFSMADEKKLLSRKTKDFSDINAFELYVNAFDNNFKKNKPKKENGSCFTCGSFSHWQRDCPMKAKQTDRRPVNRINLKKTPAEWQNQKRSIRARQRVNAIPMEETDGQTDDESDSDDSQASHMTGFAPSDDEEEVINNVEGDDTEAESESDSEEFEHMVNALTKMFRKKKSAKVNKVEGRKRTPKHRSN